MQIRPFADADAPALVALWQVCGLIRDWNDPHLDIARKRGVQPELFLVGAVGDQLVASAMGGYDGHRGWVNYLAVDPAHRHRGYAARLMTRLETLLTDCGCPKLNLQVRTSNAEAVAFYRRLGYVQDEAVSFGKRLIVDGPVR